jgi:hypothetical protein
MNCSKGKFDQLPKGGRAICILYLCTLLLCIAALLAMPTGARAQLYVGQSGGPLGEYNATTGATINANFITGLNAPSGLAVLFNHLFVTDAAGNTVGKYNAITGVAISASLVTGLSAPAGLAVRESRSRIIP